MIRLTLIIHYSVLFILLFNNLPFCSLLAIVFAEEQGANVGYNQQLQTKEW